MFDIVLAYGAGLLTLINPCVLPLLPLIAAGAVARHPLGPVAMAAGMTISFTLVGISVFWLTRAVGLQQEDVSLATGWLMIGFGLVMIVPRAQEQFARVAGGLAGGSNAAISRVETRGLGGEALAGGLLGLAWSPCIGPTLGAAIGFAAQGENLGYAFMIMLVFSLGAATVMLGLSYGARGLIGTRRDFLSRIAPHAKTILGIGLLVVGVGIVLHLDRLAEAWAVQNLPNWLVDLSVII
ncbi:MAG TPA: cytochrome c biogenesis protein CcdA [Devosia sp.]|nr:cytochrome c biogenesis protein CcdA [Devosia sp.]